MTTLTVKPARFEEDRFHYVPDLGRTDYGATDEILGQVNIDAVIRELDALGVEAFTSREKTWLCPVVALVVDAYHPATMPYLARLSERLEAYPVLDEMALSEAELEAGYCGYCGSLGLPEMYGKGDVCESCGHIVD